MKIHYSARENRNFDTHSFYAVAVPFGTVSFDEVCQEACEDLSIEVSIMKAAVTEYMRAVQANLKRGFRVQVGESFLTVYPKLVMSVKDTEDDEGNQVVATADMVTANRGKSRLGASVATKFSQEFAKNVSWQKVDTKTGALVSDDDDDIVDGGDEGPGGEQIGG